MGNHEELQATPEATQVLLVYTEQTDSILARSKEDSPWFTRSSKEEVSAFSGPRERRRK